MPEIAIVTDSASCIPPDLLNRYQIEVIPMTLMAGGKVYRDGIDITTTQAYELFLKDPDSFKTAPSSPEDCLNTFHRAAQNSKQILCITVSVKISTVYNIARLVKERAKSELPDIRIEVMDSETAAAAQGLVVLAAARAAQNGQRFEDVIEAVNEIKSRVHAVVLLDTVQHVYRSGRVPRIAAQAATVLNIKPIFSLYKTVNFVTAARTRKSGVEHLLRIMREKVDKTPIRCAVMHAYDPEEAVKLKNRITGEFNCIDIWISEFSPVMGYATGTGTLGLAFHTEI